MPSTAPAKTGGGDRGADRQRRRRAGCGPGRTGADAAEHLSPEHHAGAPAACRLPPSPRDRSGAGAGVAERGALGGEAAGAWRPRGDEAVRSHPAWADLDPAGRLEVYEVSRLLRRLEAALDPEGLSTTARAVLRRIGG